ncbi:hypothetical protein CXG45_17285 [Pseudomonas plecoglossicida]|uniref:Uncharacterized protein n=1 Tax=Pseudomonas plecoglossicida TaxID=70775 RepID=A0ABX4TXW9_PSEDL|nr:hypothetical protein CXG44_15380 [Pseudomonas plecoglossicida]QKK96774.1 hypothetical protein GEV38_12635 [Pseudomonas sp. 13159349]TXI03756.1 MAG: hypothetical protein E6Q70_14910 [Pseudomonas monteilii]PLU91843.1 hypothetical protein CXG45_17285 [Pseudomonas plecoglossicida]PLV03842.1 hypothetical protein CXG48_11520 [Pseudomonas plecoglossicida]
MYCKACQIDSCRRKEGLAGDRPALWAALSRRELNSQARRGLCGSGRAREKFNAVVGTGCAGVRGGSTPRHARSHRGPAQSSSYMQFHEGGPVRSTVASCRSRLDRPRCANTFNMLQACPHR